MHLFYQCQFPLKYQFFHAATLFQIHHQVQIFCEFNHIFFNHSEHKKSVPNVIYLHYCKIFKRVYSLVTIITNLWMIFEASAKIIVIIDFTFFWFLSFVFVFILVFVTHTNTRLNKFVDTIFYTPEKHI